MSDGGKVFGDEVVHVLHVAFAEIDSVAEVLQHLRDEDQETLQLALRFLLVDAVFVGGDDGWREQTQEEEPCGRLVVVLRDLLLDLLLILIRHRSTEVGCYLVPQVMEEPPHVPNMCMINFNLNEDLGGERQREERTYSGK